MPRWATNGGRIGFIGFLQKHIDSGQSAQGLGEVAWVKLTPRVLGGELPPPVDPTPTPYPSPTVIPTPPPTQTPSGDSQIFSIGHYDFDSVGDGWQFYKSADFAPPIARTQSTTGETYLELTANSDNTNTFGFYASPPRALDLFPFDPSSTPAPDYYLFRGYLRRTTDDPSMSPGLRLRVNSRDFQSYSTVESYSVAELFAVPAKDTLSAMDLVFQPPREIYDLTSDYENYTLSFDLLNFMPEDDATGGFRLERVDLFRITSGSTGNLNVVGSADTKMKPTDLYSSPDEAQAGILSLWESGGLPSKYTVPVLSFGTYAIGADGYHGRFSGQVVAPASANFGFWSTLPAMLSVNVPSGGPYFLRLQTTVSSSAAAPLSNPEIRYRISSARFSTTATHGIVPTSEANLTPSSGNSRTHLTFFPIPQGVSGDFPIMIGWDLMSFLNWPETNSDPVYLDSVQLDVVQFTNYPAPASLP